MSRERKEQFWRWAQKLARSGEHSGYISVEHALYEIGFKAARQWLTEDMREEVDRLCAQAQKGKAKAQGT